MSNSGTKVYQGQVGGTKVGIKEVGAAVVHGIVLLNETAAVAYLQIFNRPSASVTVGTTVPVLSGAARQRRACAVTS